MILRTLLKRLTHRPLKLWAKWYSSQTRNYLYENGSLTSRIKVLPGVFHPALFLSTQFLLKYLEKQDLMGLKLLELGCGSGLISVVCAKKGANVFASDINPQAVENVKSNAALNHVEVTAYVSDLFQAIPPQTFDYLVINPPYYPKNATDDSEKAWFCGENFEYFDQLFRQLPTYLHQHSQIRMILSEDCELAQIQQIARLHHFDFELLVSKKVMAEQQLVFGIDYSFSYS
ncbi:MAG: methyltransferase [Bacteroidia bacterium]